MATYNGNSLTGKEKFLKGDIINFSYSGSIKNITFEKGYQVLLEVWGAQGGTVTYSNTTYAGGKGGYSKGEYYFSNDQKLYICVGQQGNGGLPPRSAAYNGGGAVNVSGTDRQSASGGGASHIALVTGLLSSLSSKKSSIVIVAGGGGGSYRHHSGAQYSGIGGTGGGTSGGNPTSLGSSAKNYGSAGTQTAGGTWNGSFGQGGTPPNGSHGSGGGGGYFGGGASRGNSGSDNSPGAGGSGFISSLITEASTVNGQRSGHGYIRITILKDNGLDLKPNSNIYDNSYSVQTFDYESFYSILGE